jgi:hypothetical protein
MSMLFSEQAVRSLEPLCRSWMFFWGKEEGEIDGAGFVVELGDPFCC